MHERVAQRCRRAVHDRKLHANICAHGGKALDHIQFQRHEHHVQITIFGGAHHLIAPFHFIQGERHVLLGLIRDDLPNLFAVHTRRREKFRETLKARSAHVRIHTLHANLLAIQQILQHLLEQPGAISLLQTALPQRNQLVLGEHQRAVGLRLKQRHLQCRRTAIQCQNRFHSLSGKQDRPAIFAVHIPRNPLRQCTPNRQIRNLFAPVFGLFLLKNQPFLVGLRIISTIARAESTPASQPNRPYTNPAANNGANAANNRCRNTGDSA